MATTGSSKATFAICYGFMEGRLHSRGLRKALIKHGYTESVPEQADIIIAHSAGCWLIPESASPKLVIYVGMPLAMVRPRSKWVSVTFTSLFRGNIIKDLGTRLKNTYHGLLDIRRNIRIMQNPQFGKPRVFPNAHAIFIANRYDAWPRGELAAKLLNEKAWTFMSLTGSHEDVWEHPTKYADIIRLYAEQVLA